MGSDEDPEDGKAVAGAVFGAVAVYAVSFLQESRRDVVAMAHESGASGQKIKNQGPKEAEKCSNTAII